MAQNKGYSVRSSNTNSCRAKASNMSVHFKNTIETARVLRGMNVKRATAYLKNIGNHKECVPFRKYNGGVGRCAQAKQFKTTQVSKTIAIDFRRN